MSMLSLTRWWFGCLLIAGICTHAVLCQGSLLCDPVFTPPDPDQNYATVYWPIPRPTDVDGDPAAVTCNTPRGSRFEGLNLIDCIATDTSDRDSTTSCQFGVFVSPTFDRGCPADIAQERSNDSNVVFLKPVGNKNFGNTDLSPVVCDHASGDVFDDGLTIVTCTATDPSINNLMAHCSFKVTIGVLPKFEDFGSCNGTAIINTAPDEGLNTATAITGRWTRPTQAGDVEAVCDPNPDTHSFPAGATTVLCTIADADLPTLIDTCSFEVHVFPTFPAGCPATIVTDDGATVDFSPPVAKDSAGKTMAGYCDRASNETFPAGETTVRCSATDSVQTTQTVICSFVVAVGIAPGFDSRGSCSSGTVNVPPDEGMMTASGLTGKWVRPTRVGGGEAVCVPDPDTATFLGGKTQVRCTIQNATAPSITSSCTFDVGVFPAFESETLLGDPFRSPDPGTNNATYAYLDPLAKDDTGLSLPVVCNPPSGTLFNGGIHGIQCVATDSSISKDSTYKFTLTVAPTFKTLCPDDIIQVNSWVNFTVPIGNKDSEDEPFPVACTKNDGDDFVPGDTIVICTVTDPVTKLVATCSFMVTIVVAPTFDASPACDEDFEVEPAPDDDEAIAVIWPERTATQVDGKPANVTCVPVSGSDFEAGDTNVTCTAVDTRLPADITPSIECTFRVRVYPTFAEGCPDDIIQVVNASESTTIVTYETPEGAIDSGGKEAGNVTCDPRSGSAFRNDNETEVTCTVLDSVTFGKATCTFTVSFLQAPTFNPDPPCDKDMNVTTSPGANMALAVIWPQRTATQEDGNPANVSCIPASGSHFPGGDNLVTCIATDKRSPETLITTCKFLLRVYPTFVSGCPANIVVPPGEDNTTLVDFEIPEGALDSTGKPANVTCDPNTGFAFPNNAFTEVTCTAVDSDEEFFPNVTTCTFKVTVGVAPTFAEECPADIIVAPDDTGEAIVTWDDVTGNPDSTGQPAIVHCDYESGATFNQTETRVTCTATDAGTALTANCNFTVIIDSEPPVLGCPGNLTIPADPGMNTANVTFDDPSVTDYYTPGPDIRVVCIPGSNVIFPYGTTPVVCSAADSVDNIGTCSFEVEVTGATCPNQCTDNSVCMLQEDGTSMCICDRGYAGTQCTNENECSSNPCHSDAVCTNLDPPDFFKCQCKDGFLGDGMYTCQRYFPDVYPDIPIPDGAYNLKKIFLVVLAITDASSGGCDPNMDKTSFECSILVQSFQELVLPLYRTVSQVGFLNVMVNQTDLRKGSVVVPHTVSYNYSDPAIRAIRTEEFYLRSVEPDVTAGKLGNMLLEESCQECTTPKDITDICSIVDKEAVLCPDNSVIIEERDDNTGMCVYKCISMCEADLNYCNGGVCSQELNVKPACSDCPEGVTGPQCTTIVDPPYEPNIPLIVGLSVGLGGTALLIVILNLLYCAFRGRGTKNNLQDGVNNGSVENSKEISMEER